jgi:hypothetical protein
VAWAVLDCALRTRQGHQKRQGGRVFLAVSGTVLAGERASGERASGERASGERASGERASGERASGERARGERASGERASGERASGERAQKRGALGSPWLLGRITCRACPWAGTYAAA